MEGCLVLNKLQFSFLYLFQIYQQDIIARNFIDGYGKKQIYQAGARLFNNENAEFDIVVVVIVKRKKNYESSNEKSYTYKRRHYPLGWSEKHKSWKMQ